MVAPFFGCLSSSLRNPPLKLKIKQVFPLWILFCTHHKCYLYPITMLFCMKYWPSELSPKKNTNSKSKDKPVPGAHQAKAVQSETTNKQTLTQRIWLQELPFLQPFSWRVEAQMMLFCPTAWGLRQVPSLLQCSAAAGSHEFKRKRSSSSAVSPYKTGRWGHV